MTGQRLLHVALVDDWEPARRVGEYEASTGVRFSTTLASFTPRPDLSCRRCFATSTRVSNSRFSSS